ncbi:hypothetical protein FBUS_05478 [Fasciolopsis buskii]|uniref:Uncharacterized protein n=1 Tax=Fasciolopsis buskii TaxID=27845 RepID=A0A8E0RU54_9TREM|nr:hypothetical protein FBUS_05478 [Fasciolopsis buski]
MRCLLCGSVLFLLLTGLVISAPPKSTSKVASSTINSKSEDEKHSKATAAEKLSPTADSVKQHTKENSGVLLGKHVQKFQKNLGQDKGGKLPIGYFDHIGSRMQESKMPRTILMKTSIESGSQSNSGELSESRKLPMHKYDTRVSSGKINPSETEHLGRMDKLNSFKSTYQILPHYPQLQTDVEPREHLNSLSIRRGKHAERNRDDNYRMYQLTHGNSRNFGKHPSDMEGYRPHGSRWSEMGDTMDHFTGISGKSGRWSSSEPHLHHARQDAPEYGMSARRMYGDAYDYRKPEWMGESKPEVYRDQYKKEYSSAKYSDRFMSNLGAKPSFSEREWSRRRPDGLSFGGFGKHFF